MPMPRCNLASIKKGVSWGLNPVIESRNQVEERRAPIQAQPEICNDDVHIDLQRNQHKGAPALQLPTGFGRLPGLRISRCPDSDRLGVSCNDLTGIVDMYITLCSFCGLQTSWPSEMAEAPVKSKPVGSSACRRPEPNITWALEPGVASRLSSSASETGLYETAIVDTW